MSKLYPPYIEGTIPAFCDTNEGTVLTVPFSMNRAVSKKEVAGFYLKVKTIQSDKYFITIKSDKFNLETQEVYFDLTNVKNKLNIGQFYKIQIAYVSTQGEIGYYSSVGVVKYTSYPKVYIEGLNKNVPNRHIYNYLGCYSQESLSKDDIKDYNEKVYSYRFVIFDKNDNYIYDTGYLLHNNSFDVNSYESQDECSYINDLDVNQVYYIQYHITTINGLKVSSLKYKITSTRSIEPDVKTVPALSLNFDNGYVDVSLDSKNYMVKLNERTVETPVSGSFVLSRKTIFSPWEEIHRFALINEKLSEWHWQDFTVEQGKSYTYAIQEYNDYGLYSDRVISDEIYIDFEDAFLFDGERQLKIRYNPKISSFKTDHLESKIDTIGSKFPFIFRNGNVSYKEFPISGLISYQMDEANLFTEIEKRFTSKYKDIRRIATMERNNFNKEYYENLGLSAQDIFDLSQKYNQIKELEYYLDNNKNKTTNLVGYNISAERDFKLEVLDWLNNGKPKLFRSPSEGNYIVRLLNTSLSPEDGVGRMLHTFSTTAYEIAECNYENLNKYGFISISEPDTTQMRWISVSLLEKSTQETKETYIELMQHKEATSVYFYDMIPGEIVYINNKPIIIGATGTYFIENTEIIYSIKIPSKVVYRGTLTYGFEDNAKNTFDAIVSVDIRDIAAHQFIGSYENVLNLIEDLKTSIFNFYYLDFNKRDVILAYAKWIGSDYEKNGQQIVLYDNKSCTHKIAPLLNSQLLYNKVQENYNLQIQAINTFYDTYEEEIAKQAYNTFKETIINDYYNKLIIHKSKQKKYTDISEEQYNQFLQEVKDSKIFNFESMLKDKAVNIYMIDSKEVALEKAKERYLLILSLLNIEGEYIENPFAIYKYELAQFEIETSDGKIMTTGFDLVEEVIDQKTGEYIKGKLTEEYFLLPEDKLKDRYYIWKDGAYIPITVFDPNIEEYYMKKPFEFYYDPKQPFALIVSEDTLNRMQKFSNDIKTEFLIYTIKFWIDGSEFDLSDDINYNINSLVKFNEIKMDCGVILNCGYGLTLVEYFEEQYQDNYQLLKDLKYLISLSYREANSALYDQLLKATNLYSTLQKYRENYNTLHNIQLTDEETKKLFFDDIVFIAWSLYDTLYPLYINKLSKVLKEKEVIE